MESDSPAHQHVIRVSPDLELRPITGEDAEKLYSLVEANRDRLRQWLPWLDSGYRIEHMQQHIAEREQSNLDGTAFTACIWHAGSICGVISLHHIDTRHRNTSIGYWIAQEQEGQGIMTQACKALVSHAFSHYRLHRIEIRCALGNSRSKGVPQRLGFCEEGVLREAEWLYDHWVDLRVFSMLKQDWVATSTTIQSTGT